MCMPQVEQLTQTTTKYVQDQDEATDKSTSISYLLLNKYLRISDLLGD